MNMKLYSRRTNMKTWAESALTGITHADNHQRLRQTRVSRRCRLALAVLSFGAMHLSYGTAIVRNADNPGDNPYQQQLFLADIGVTPEFRVGFESGFTEGQNLKGVTNLFPGGLVFYHTDAAVPITVTSQKSLLGGSYPVGIYCLRSTEKPWLLMDFSARPVDYVSFMDIDHTASSVQVVFADNRYTSYALDTTGAGGNSAEFWGVFRNDMPRIKQIYIDPSGAAGWGLDDIQYGVINAQPTDIVLSYSIVSSNWPAGTTVGTFSAVDPDAGDTFSYSLVAGAGDTHNALFAIVGDTVQLAQSPRFGINTVLSVRVRATDYGGLACEKVFGILVGGIRLHLSKSGGVAQIAVEGLANQGYVIETTSALHGAPLWTAVRTNLLTAGWGYWSDTNSVGKPQRYYRVRLTPF